MVKDGLKCYYIIDNNGTLYKAYYRLILHLYQPEWNQLSLVVNFVRHKKKEITPQKNCDTCDFDLMIVHSFH